MDDDDRQRNVVAIGTKPRGVAHPVDPDIETERGLARDAEVIITTETYDEADGSEHVRHAGDDPELHRVLLTARARLLVHRVTEDQRLRRLLAWLGSGLLLGSAALFAFAPQRPNVYMSAALLLVAGGAFSIKSFRIRVKDFELDVGELPTRSKPTPGRELPRSGELPPPGSMPQPGSEP